MCLGSSFTVQRAARRGSPPLLSHGRLQSRGRVELSVGARICLLSLSFSIPLCSSAVLSFVLSVCPMCCVGEGGALGGASLHRGGPGCFLCLACADAHGAASLCECDHFNNPSFTFLSCFQSNERAEACFSATQIMDSVAMVFCNRTNENASCLL